MINYQHFAELEIKLGEIKSVEIVEDADKLLKLMVDVGEDKERQIISGIREHFPEPDSLVGKQCPFLTNLEPRVIRGYESNGMILALSDETNFSLLIPETKLENGSKVK